MENRTILFQGKEIDVDDEPGETSDMIHHPDHYTWKGVECKTVIQLMTVQRKAWQKSIRSHKLKSRCRHAKHGYKGGR